MKLNLKDLKQSKFQVDVEGTDSVGEVKRKIEELRGDAAASQKLIYSGKILADDKTVADYQIKEKDFVVCMVQKPKQVKKEEPKEAAKEPAKQPAKEAAVEASEPKTEEEEGTAGPQERGLSDSTLSTGGARETAVQGMVEMGFEKAQVERAMRAAFNNPDRATEYLFNGIPESNEAPAASSSTASGEESMPTPPAAPIDATTTSTGGAASGNLFEQAAQAAQGFPSSPTAGSGGAAGANLDFLRNNPQFQQLRQIVQQNPQMLEPILQQVASGNPGLAQLINQNPEAFLQLLAEGVQDEEGNGPLPGQMQIQVTEEENAAIERLCGLGFERNSVIQAYIACDKNEEIAANYLFEHGNED